MVCLGADKYRAIKNLLRVLSVKTHILEKIHPLIMSMFLALCYS